MQRGRRGFGRVEEGLRGSVVLRSLEVLRAQYQVAMDVPIGRAAMQRAPRAVQQRRVCAITDQRMREGQFAAAVDVAHQVARSRLLEQRWRTAHEMGDERRVEALAR